MVNYTKGDATLPQGSGIKIVAHVCNDIGRFGSGFAKAVMERWPIVREEYIKWSKAGVSPLGVKFILGEVQFIQVQNDLWFANIIGQHGVRSPHDKNSPPPVKYDAIRSGLKKVRTFAQALGATIHGPRFGAGLAGGDWNEIEKIITEELVGHGVEITIYDLV